MEDIFGVVRKIHAMGITRISASSMESLGIVPPGTGASWVAVLSRSGHLIPIKKGSPWHEQAFYFNRDLSWKKEAVAADQKDDPPVAQ